MNICEATKKALEEARTTERSKKHYYLQRFHEER